MPARTTASRIPRALIAATATITPLLLSNPLAADDIRYRWSAPVSGAWTDTTRWSPTGYPGRQRSADDSATIDARGTPYTIDFSIPVPTSDYAFFTDFVLDSPDAKLNVTATTSTGAGLSAKQLTLEQGRLTLRGALGLTVDHVRLKGGTLAVEGPTSNVRMSTVSFTNNGDLYVAHGAALAIQDRQFDDRLAAFVHSGGATLRLDGPLTLRGGHFRNEGGSITGTSAVYIYDHALVQARVPDGPGGTFVFQGESFLGGDDPALNRIFAGQTVSVQHTSTAPSEFPVLHVHDGFRNDGTLILESPDSNKDVFLSVRRPLPEPATPGGTMTNSGTFRTNPGSSGAGRRFVTGTFVNEATGAMTLNGSTEIWALTNSGTVSIAPGATLSIGTPQGPNGAFVQKAGTLNVPGTVQMNQGTFVHEGGVISGNPTFLGMSRLVNESDEDLGAATFVFDHRYPNTTIGRGASGNVLIRRGQTVRVGPNSRAFTADFGFTNAGTLIVEENVSVAGSASDVNDGVLTNTGTIEMPEHALTSRIHAAVHNAPTGTLNVSKRNASISGLVNAGAVNVNPDALITVGPTTNTGTITVRGAPATFLPTSIGFGTLENDGLIDLAMSGATISGAATNSGRISVGDGAGFQAMRSFVNRGEIRFAPDTRATFHAGFENDGTLILSEGVRLSLAGPTPTQRFTNTGLLDLAGGTIDLASGELLNPYAGLAEREAALATLNEHVRSARNSPRGRWKGPGITTSDYLGPHQTLAVGATDEAVIVRRTYNGDANLDGRINADDYFRIDQGFLAQPSDPLFSQGDFNYDGTINADDYFLIDQAFLGQGAPLGTSPGLLATAAVPEPGLATAALAGAALLLRRRRRLL